MGHVRQGTDVYPERLVAVMTVAADLLALPDRRRTALARFEREARAAARPDHANLTTVHDAAVTDDVCCLVMQLVDGTTLDGADDGRLPVPAAASVAAQLCLSEVVDRLSLGHLVAAGRDVDPQARFRVLGVLDDPDADLLRVVVGDQVERLVGTVVVV